MKRFLCSAVISIISSTLLVPQAARSADDGLCFLRIESGRIIGLDALCLQRLQEKPMQEPSPEEFIKGIKERFPDFYTYDDLPPDLKARAVRQNGRATIKLAPGETMTMPSGTRVEADGSTVRKSGVRVQIVRQQDGEAVGVRVFKPDGTELKPGEKYTEQDGTIIKVSN
jgi:hypothetical protein